MTCGKVTYTSRRQAKEAMKKMNHTNICQKKLTDVYFCDECQHWHLTSMGKRQSRRLKKMRK